MNDTSVTNSSANAAEHELAALLVEGNAALRAGNALEARKHFRRVTEQAPTNVDAWMGMASAVRPLREKQEYLQRALALDPANADIRASLAYVEEKLAAGEVLAPRANPAPEAASVEPAPVVDIIYCYRHPDRETGLHCVQCGRPICTECVRPAFVGQLCPDCFRERRPRNYQVTTRELIITALVTQPIGMVITFLVLQVLGFTGFFGFIIAFLLGPAAAEMILRILDRVTQAKRGKEMQLTAGITYGLGAAIWLLPQTLFGFPPLAPLLFTFIVIATLVGRLR